MCISFILIFNRVYIIINIYYLQYYSLNYTDFLSNVIINNQSNNLSEENNKLKSELNTYRTENKELKNRITKLKNDNDTLNKELIKAQKLLANYTQNNQIGNNNINQLNEKIKMQEELIKMKDKEILDLKIRLENNDVNNKSVKFNDILSVHFISMDQNINYPIKCLKTDTFAEIEEKLYQKYDNYRNSNNNFVANGRVILRFKKIYENGIKDGDKVTLVNI